jgi:hypothetical protein
MIRSVEEHPTSARLAGQLGDELAQLLRCDAELAMAERMPEIRRTAGEAAVLGGGIVALLFALAGGTWAAGLAIASVTRGWAAALIVAGVWVVVALVLLRQERPRRLFSRLSDQNQADVISSARAERRRAEETLRATAARLAEALLHDAEVRGMHAAASAARHGVDEAEQEAARLIAQIADALRDSGRAGGRGFLDWLKGGGEEPARETPA